MKIIIQVQEPASFFHIVDSLSNWSIHTRKEIRNYYKQRFKLTQKDKDLLKKYSLLRKKYSWKQLDSDFIPAKDFKEVNIRLKKRLNQKEFKLMQEVIANFYENTHKIFLEYQDLLKKRKKSIQELMTPKLLNIFNEICEFYSVKKCPSKIYIHLLINPVQKHSGGGANVFPAEHITLEPSYLDSQKKQHTKHNLAVIVHEIIHLIEKRVSRRQWNEFEKRVKKEKINFPILREAIADSIAPKGYLTKKYKISPITVKKYKRKDLKKIKNKKEFYLSFREKLAGNIYSLTKKQIKKNKNIFQGNYIESCINKYLKLKKLFK